MHDRKELIKAAQDAALWLLERKDNPPEIVVHTDLGRETLRFNVGDILFEYRPKGVHRNENPWKNVAPMDEFPHDEGPVAIGICPRHNRERRLNEVDIPIRPLRIALLIGTLVGCSDCSSKTVVVRNFRPQSIRSAEWSLVRPMNLCAECATRLRAPKSIWVAEPPYHTELEIRGPAREALASLREQVKDVECRSCVTVSSGRSSGFGVSETYPFLRRTYERPRSY
jgi:hypothetical protein